MLPLFMPSGMTFDRFLRALIGGSPLPSPPSALYGRGHPRRAAGDPKGQYEGASSLGLGYWQSMGLIVMPQAMKLVIPGIVNTFIGPPFFLQGYQPRLHHWHVRPARHRSARTSLTPTGCRPRRRCPA